MIIIGIDPGLRFNGWGIIDVRGQSFIHIANGTFKTNEKEDLSKRLLTIYQNLSEVIKKYNPEVASVEEVFVNVNPASTLKLGQARGVAMLTPQVFGIPVFEYAANLVKKSITGVGHASKEQIEMMVSVLLSKPVIDSEHSADALAIAITHANNIRRF